MGTNYFYETAARDICPACGRGGEIESLHIGKSSAGWAFALHILPERNIRSLGDWQRVWAAGGQIRDEYGEYVSVPQMLKEITERTHPRGLNRHIGRMGPDDIYVKVAEGEPTYDLCEYEFS